MKIKIKFNKLSNLFKLQKIFNKINFKQIQKLIQNQKMIKNIYNKMQKSLIKVFMRTLLIKLIIKINLKAKKRKSKFTIITYLKKVYIKFKKNKAKLFKFKIINHLKTKKIFQIIH